MWYENIDMDSTLLRSYIWKDIHNISLTRNMRAMFDPWFSEYLLRMGNDTENMFAGDYVHLPKISSLITRMKTQFTV
jgi:hypothetical protein